METHIQKRYDINGRGTGYVNPNETTIPETTIPRSPQERIGESLTGLKIKLDYHREITVSRTSRALEALGLLNNNY